MRRKHSIGLAAAILVVFTLLGAVAADAQRMAPSASTRTSGVTVRALPVGARIPAMRPAGPRNTARVRSGMRFDRNTNSFVTADGTSLTLQQLLDPFPAPGFDFEHLAAIDRDLDIKAVIDPATELRLGVAERLLRDTRGFTNSGFFLLDGGGAFVVPAEPAEIQPPSQQQPQVIVLQQAPAAQQAAAQPEPEASAPLPDVGQFTLVLRNGKQIEATAFTRRGDRIIYITTEGSRRTIAAADLDSGATMRVNEERGTPLQLTL